MKKESEIKIGHIDISQLNAPPEKHEFATAKYFADMGKDIVFLKPSDIPNIHTPDILMDGIEWEMKCPSGNSKRTIETNLRNAAKQSHYIIFDLRRIQVPEKQCFAQLDRLFYSRSDIKRLLVIKKNNELFEYLKGS